MQGADGQVERYLADHLAAGLATLEVGDHLVGDLDRAEAQPAAAPVAALALGDDPDVGDLARGGRPVGVGAGDHGDVVVEVEGLDEPGVAAVHVDRAGVGRGVGARRVDVADHPPGLGLDQGDRAAAGRADVGEVGGAVAVGPEPAARSPPQPALLDEAVEEAARGRAEQREVGLGQRQLLGGGAQVGRQDVLVGGVDDRGLDRLAEQRLGVRDQIGVERVVAGDEHAESVAVTATGAADLLPHRGPGAGEARHHHGVEPADVDAELERVGGGQPGELAGAQGPLDRAAFLGEVAAAVGRDLAGQRRVDVGEQVGRGQRNVLGPAPRPDEGERAHALEDQVGQQVGGLGRGGAAHGRAVLAGVGRERRLPERDRDLAARRGVVDDRQHVEPGEPMGVHLGLGDGGRGEHERRVGAVRRAHPPQPPQHLRDVRAEHAPVVVALVDHDVVQRAQELRPAVVGGQQGPVQHVGVGQHVLGVVAGPLPLLARAVAVVGGDADVEPQRLEPGQLVLGQRLGRAEVEGRRAALLAADRAASGSRPAWAAGSPATFPTRCRWPSPTCRPAWAASAGVDLVSPRGAEPARLERRADVVGHPARPRGLDGGPGGQHLEMGQPLLAAGDGGQPRHDVAQRQAGRDLGGHAAILPSGSDIRVRARVSPDAARGPCAYGGVHDLSGSAGDPGLRTGRHGHPATAYYFHERRDGVV